MSDHDPNAAVDMLYGKTAYLIKYAQHTKRSGSVCHFPHHCQERTSGMSDSNSTVRFCPKCQRETSRTTNGQCKPCNAIRAAAWRKANPDKACYLRDKWASENPEKVKASVHKWNSSNKQKLRSDRIARYAANPQKEKVKNSEWYAENKERVKAYGKQWNIDNPDSGRRKNHTRRARKNSVGGSLSKGIAARLFLLQKGKCPCCGLPLGTDYHIDHITPLSLGGSNSDDNAQLLRAECNLKKSAKHPIQYMQEKGFLL